MGKKIIYFGALLLLVGIVPVNPAFSGMECDGTQYNGVYYRKGQHYDAIKNGVAYDCEACGNCTPKGSGSTFVAPFGRLSPAQQMGILMMQGIFQPFFDAMYEDTFSSPDTSGQEELARWQEEEERKQEEMKKQALEAWQKAQEEIATETARQEAQNKEAGLQILARSRIGDDVTLEPSLFGTCQPKLGAGSITSGDPTLKNELEAGSVSSDYPAPESELGKARCAAYFSKLANNTEDPDGARFLSLQAEKVMHGAPTDYPCRFDEMPDVPVPRESYAKNEDVEAFINNYQARLREFEEIQARVNKARKQKLEAEARLSESDMKINELRAKSSAISNPEEKAQIDYLISQEMSAKQEARNDLNAAMENVQELLDAAKLTAEEIEAANDKISSLKQGNK